MPIGRRRIGRPGLVGTMARTAVVAGTATAVHGGMSNRQAKKQAAAQQAEQEPAAPPAAAPAATPEAATTTPTTGAADDEMIARLQQLADLKAQGILDDEEFAAAKAKVIAE